MEDAVVSFAAYGHALVSLAGVALIAMVLNPWSGASKSAAGLQPGQEPPPNYADRVYRVHRAYLNATEFLAIFAAVVASAVLAGVDPFWTNTLASVVLVARVVHVAVHVAGVGAPNLGPRTFAFVIGWLMCVILAIMTIFAAVSA